MIQAPYSLEALRAEQFPVAQTFAYLNHASISPLPTATAQAMHDAIDRSMNDPSAMFPWFMERSQALLTSLCKLINAQQESEIVSVQSTSLGNNLVAHAMPWQRGQNIVLCDVEFPSNAYPWIQAAGAHGVEVRLLPANLIGLSLDALAKVVDSQTALVAVSAMQFLSGHRTDLMTMGQFCHERNIIFAVDAIQAVGIIPIDVQAMHIGILCAGGQKALMGPPGQGFLYVRSDLAEQMKPDYIGGNGTVDYLHWLKYDMTPLPGAARFSMGTPNIAGIIGLGASVKLLTDIGVANIDAHVTALASYLIDQLRASGYQVLTPDDHASIVTFQVAPTEEATVAIMNHLTERKVVVAKHWDAQKNPYLRASFHCYNNQDDVDRLLNALRAAKPA